MGNSRIHFPLVKVMVILLDLKKKKRSSAGLAQSFFGPKHK